MKEFIIKNDKIKLPDNEQNLNFVTNDDKEGVRVSKGYNGLPKIADNRVKKEIIFNDAESYDVTHRNYLKYLDFAYSYDCGIVIKPDFIWFTILCEIATLVKNNPDDFRDYFTTNTNKEKIIVHSDDVSLPIDEIFEILISEKIPSNLTEDLIVPKFSTLDIKSEQAFKSTFLDTVSPFYYYGVMWCGYNKIKILGDQSDYILISETLNKISEKIPPLNDYYNKIKLAIDEIILNWNDVDYWKEICKTETNYGKRIVDGWFKNFFETDYESLTEFPEHLTKLDYSDELGSEYTLYTGILSSKFEDGYLIPNFNKIIAKKLKQNKK